LADSIQAGQVLLKRGLDTAGTFGTETTYTGGIVFQNPRDARRYIDEEWNESDKAEMAVFEVNGSWMHDCYSIDEGTYWRYLLYSRPITLLVVDAKDDS